MKQKTIIALVFLWIASISIFSCAANKGTASAPEIAEDLSFQLGMNITADDNLALYKMVAQWIGTPHKMGRNTKNGTDCSGFVTNVYQKIYNKKLERSSADMLATNCRRISKSSLQEGDLVFFYTTNKSKRPSHVGIYLKDGKFAHSSTSKGVIISDLSEPYYKKRWISGGIVK